jgi:hypothetical protein
VAYEESTYGKVKEKFSKIRRDLQWLGLFQEYGISFKTTNCIESLMALIGQKTNKVGSWENCNQKHR